MSRTSYRQHKVVSRKSDLFTCSFIPYFGWGLKTENNAALTIGNCDGNTLLYISSLLRLKIFLTINNRERELSLGIDCISENLVVVV